MIGSARWRENWRLVSPAGAIRIDLRRSRAGRDDALRYVRELPMGSGVVLCASAPGAARRCRRFAAEAGVALEREYLTFPSASEPAYIVEAARAPLELFIRSVLVAPPAIPFSGAIGAGLAVVRRTRPSRLLRALAPGRIVVGRCR